MKEFETPESFGPILREYEHQLAWLESLITDPTGNRYLIEKSPAERLFEYQQQLNRTKKLLDYCGNPQQKFRSVHVAGTGGKGSTAAMIGNLLEATGQRVGIHTSPYLQLPNEKLLINQQMIPPSRFSRLIAEFRPKLDKFIERYPNLAPRYVEVWAALTYLFFAEEQVDWGVIETGMGGRFDPTNILLPEVAVITNVDFDHVPQLGTSIEEIAYHKAGIIKSGRPVVTGEKKPEVLRIIETEAKKQQAPMFRLGKEFSVAVKKADNAGSIIDVTTPFSRYENVGLNLCGNFQPNNAAVAVMAAELACRPQQIQLSPKAVEQALSGINFPGRMEKIHEHPTVILDGAHNPQKTRALSESIKQIYGDRPYTLIIGMLATKDVRQAIASLLPQAGRIMVTSPKVIGKPAVSTERMKELILEADPGKIVETEEAIPNAISRVLETSAADDLIVVAGSIYMLGEARNYWVPRRQLLAEAEYGASS